MTPPPLAALSWPIVSRIPLVGDLAVSPHGIAIGIGFAVGAVMMIRRARSRGITPPDAARDLDASAVADEVQRVLGWALVGAIVAARLFYVLTHADVYAADPGSILAIQEGGLTFVGGLAGGVVTGWFVARRRGLDPVALVDAAAPGLALGLAIGRLGDLAIGDHLGAPTSAPWGWRCTGDLNPVGDPNALGMTAPVPYPEMAVRSGAIEAPVVGCFDVPVLQTALVDAVVALVVLAVLLAIERRVDWRRGSLASAWVVVYGVLRVAGDVLREDRRWFGLTGTQWALSVAVVVVVAMWWRRRRAAASRVA